jgi:hypothetical protein
MRAPWGRKEKPDSDVIVVDEKTDGAGEDERDTIIKVLDEMSTW